MTTSLIYRNASVYEFAMFLLYGRHYTSRYSAIAELIPEGASVLDLCCGPAILYHRYLQSKAVQYIGMDINANFIARLIHRGGSGKVWDLRLDEELPAADYVIMQASLYHFLPDASPVVDRMLQAARKRVMIAEPIRNLATSSSRLLSLLGQTSTNPGVGGHSLRFTEASLADFFSGYASLVVESFKIAGGREQLYVMEGRHTAGPSKARQLEKGVQA
jgi:SAM-dependent methyltransferase